MPAAANAWARRKRTATRGAKLTRAPAGAFDTLLHKQLQRLHVKHARGMQTDALQHEVMRVLDLDVSAGGHQAPFRIVRFVPSLKDKDGQRQMRTLLTRLTKRQRLRCIVIADDPGAAASSSAEPSAHNCWHAREGDEKLQSHMQRLRSASVMQGAEQLSSMRHFAVPDNCCLVYM